MYRSLKLLCLFAFLLPAAAAADEAEDYGQIRDLLRSDKLDDAEKLFEAALKEYPDSARIKGLRYLLYFYNSRADRHDAALAHITAHVDGQLETIQDSPGSARSLPTYVDIMLSAMKPDENAAAARAKLDDVVAAVRKVGSAQEEQNTQLLLVLIGLENRQITLLAETGQSEAAEKLLEKRMHAAEKAVAGSPEDAVALMRHILLGKARSELLAQSDSAASREARDQYVRRLFDTARKNKKSIHLAIAALDNGVEIAGRLSRKDPTKAEQLLKELNEFVETIETEDEILKSRLASLERSTESIERSIEGAKAHLALIGKQALPLDVEAWTNGKPLSDDDLKGKVVLLDFWAVWCGPCIATFPHLREWREMYEDKGLVIIGVTRFYQFGWNEENSRPERIAELSAEDELEAMGQFAAHHELKHRFMVVPEESEFHDKYEVTGIPQAVVIDRQGKIRLIRVGSGEDNASEIAALLDKLFDDKATPAE